MKISEDVFVNIYNTLGKLVPENGGVLGIKHGIVCEYYFDCNAYKTGNMYAPSTDVINVVIGEWKTKNIEFCGIIHSHPAGIEELSYNDIVFAKMILSENKSLLKKIYFPVVQSVVDNGNFEIFPYAVVGENVLCEKLKIVNK